jgi:hypothetical protein
VNKKLEDLITRHPVQAVFLNKYYNSRQATVAAVEENDRDRTTMEDRRNTFRFLGYYQFVESRYVVGDDQNLVNKEFSLVHLMQRVSF